MKINILSKFLNKKKIEEDNTVIPNESVDANEPIEEIASNESIDFNIIVEEVKQIIVEIVEEPIVEEIIVEEPIIEEVIEIVEPIIEEVIEIVEEPIIDTKSIFISNKIEVRKSEFENGGHGVFAKQNIRKDEIIEVAKFVYTSMIFYDIPYSLSSVVYMFPRDSNNPKCVITLGYGSIYNSSLSKSGRNADWYTDEESELFKYRALVDINIGEEILIYYNNHEF